MKKKLYKLVKLLILMNFIFNLMGEMKLLINSSSGNVIRLRSTNIQESLIVS